MLTISSRNQKNLVKRKFTKMDPKERSNKQHGQTPQQKLAVLRNLRDESHRLKSPDRLYNRDWFMGAVLDEGLGQVYMDDIALNFRT
jgi:hypothetical protein